MAPPLFVGSESCSLLDNVAGFTDSEPCESGALLFLSTYNIIHLGKKRLDHNSNISGYNLCSAKVTVNLSAEHWTPTTVFFALMSSNNQLTTKAKYRRPKELVGYHCTFEAAGYVCNSDSLKLTQVGLQNDLQCPQFCCMYTFFSLCLSRL